MDGPQSLTQRFAPTAFLSTSRPNRSCALGLAPVQKFCNRAENCCIAIEQMREKLSARRRFQGARREHDQVHIPPRLVMQLA